MSWVQHWVREAFGRNATPMTLSVVIGLIAGIGIGYTVVAPFFFE